MNMHKSLAIVMPVYNEADCIRRSVTEWLEILNKLGIDFVFFIIDDGSTDGTYKELAAFAGDERVQIIHQHNQGHGPAILKGYLMACERADWVFHTDSDLEIPAHHFAEFWKQRHPYDSLLGVRMNRQQTLARRTITAASRFTIKLLYSSTVIDANVPYRLVRSSCLKPIAKHLPSNTFAPNVIISGALTVTGSRILNIPVSFIPRQTGTVSLISFRLFRGVLLSFFQLLCFRYKYLPRLRAFGMSC